MQDSTNFKNHNRYSSSTRRLFLKQWSCVAVVSSFLLLGSAEAFAFQKQVDSAVAPPTNPALVAYKPLSVSVNDINNNINDVQVPVACWFPASKEESLEKSATYKHRISIRRIGQLLVGWDFIPEFLSKQYDLSPTSDFVKDGENVQNLPKNLPLVLLAHGYLGSRFDLSHLAERLSQELQCVCIAPEYPESLAASFDRMEGLDRSLITTQVLDEILPRVNPTACGSVGHSLGCGTVLQTGDKKWVRVCIAGFPRAETATRVENILFVTSTQDGLMARFGKDGIPIPSDYARLSQEKTFGISENEFRIPSKAAVVYEGTGAPNHISYLSEGVNEAMIDLLSPLLPLAQTLGIPVLDFDRYQISRDSKPTAKHVIPLIKTFLKQQMKITTEPTTINR